MWGKIMESHHLFDAFLLAVKGVLVMLRRFYRTLQPVLLVALSGVLVGDRMLQLSRVIPFGLSITHS
jgi:hypothetical protein